MTALSASTLPENIQYQDVRVRAPDGHFEAGKMAFVCWSAPERKKQAFKRTFRIMGPVIGILLITALIPAVHLITIPVLLPVALFVVTPFLFFRLMGEEATFFYVEAACPRCQKKPLRLRPFLGTGITPELTLQCPECGETCKALL